ncbi:hypothetical protein M422DRAFT_239442 [Sphaerobolus stellatus SS14]|nr:hypothetical protein M422DRAFT_239442 [Sphaerobolus stellatus SS14]
MSTVTMTSAEDFEYISRFRYIYEGTEMAKFEKWCLEHKEKKVQEWMCNKLANVRATLGLQWMSCQS